MRTCATQMKKIKGKLGESLVAQLINASSREQKVPGSSPRGGKSW